MESNCTLLIQGEKGGNPTAGELQKLLESPKVKDKLSALKTTILMLLNGESLPNLLMTVIRYCITNEDHHIKKMLSLYWEVCTKYDSSGKLLPEMILVCNALRNDLNHPNEYIRGCTLRFLCRVKELEIVEPLLASVKTNLEHRHSYVRRNAVNAVYTIYKNFGEDFFPDAEDLIVEFLKNESDPSARRNAFLMLYNTAEDRAVDFFIENADQVQKFGDGFQLAVLELTRKVCRADPGQKSTFIKVVFQLLQSESPAVSYEAAWTLVSLSNAPTAVRAAASAYTGLLASESDNNVRLIVLNKLAEMKKYHRKILQELLMDIMRALNSQNTDIRRKTLEITMDLVSPRNIDEVVLLLKKEIVKTQAKDVDKAEAASYRQLLIKAIHGCAVKFPNVAESVVNVLMDFLHGQGAMDVIVFVREIVETYDNLRESVMNKLIECLGDIRSGAVARVALWIIGEYTQSSKMREEALDAIKEALGPTPFHTVEVKKEGGDADEDDTAQASTGGTMTTNVTVLADGTYATQTSFTAAPVVSETERESIPSLRGIILGGDYLVASVVAVTLTKLALRHARKHGVDHASTKRAVADVILYACAIVEAGKHAAPNKRIDSSNEDRISLCVRLLLDPSVWGVMENILLGVCREVFSGMLSAKKEALRLADKAKNAEITAQPDQLIHFRQLKTKRSLGATDVDLDDEGTLSRATGASDIMPHLAKVHQLTGFADPVYAEAKVVMHDYDILMDVLVINRTPNTLTNVNLDFATTGDLKIVERPQEFTIGPLDFRKLKANIKVSSTDSGNIYGTIVYDSSTSASTTVVNLNDIHVDIMDYIKPATCSDATFRSFWQEFEWENKCAVNTPIQDPVQFLDHIVKSTNMKCLTPPIGGGCDFLAANLYAKSVFGEDALVNVSVEKVGDKIEGYIRIRAKTQGIALSLGDRITLKQKELPEDEDN